MHGDYETEYDRRGDWERYNGREEHDWQRYNGREENSWQRYNGREENEDSSLPVPIRSVKTPILCNRCTQSSRRHVSDSYTTYLCSECGMSFESTLHASQPPQICPNCSSRKHRCQLCNEPFLEVDRQLPTEPRLEYERQRSTLRNQGPHYAARPLFPDQVRHETQGSLRHHFAEQVRYSSGRPISWNTGTMRSLHPGPSRIVHHVNGPSSPMRRDGVQSMRSLHRGGPRDFRDFLPDNRHHAPDNWRGEELRGYRRLQDAHPHPRPYERFPERQYDRPYDQPYSHPLGRWQEPNYNRPIDRPYDAPYDEHRPPSQAVQNPYAYPPTSPQAIDYPAPQRSPQRPMDPQFPPHYRPDPALRRSTSHAAPPRPAPFNPTQSLSHFPSSAETPVWHL